MSLVDYIVRPARRTDLPLIRSLIHATHINPFGINWQHFLIAVSGENMLLGCGQIKPHFDGSIELASIATQEEFRNIGIARAIIKSLLVSETKRPIFLMCRRKLKLFYNQFGFTAIDQKEMPTYFRRINRIENILNKRVDPENRLLVMCLDRGR